uniref:MICOS complex subunit MIC13 n=1 Tax=Amphiprion percula TaxID=161767 RepID=A0A3P8TWJ3_AMPPE
MTTPPTMRLYGKTTKPRRAESDTIVANPPLGSSEQGSQALEKAKAATPPALEKWMKDFGVEAQLPTIPKTEFSLVELWNSGVRWIISSLSEAPAKASDDINQGIQYLKDFTKYTRTLWVT